ncbi:MAG: DnaJ domain-containing protein [bacterium]
MKYIEGLTFKMIEDARKKLCLYERATMEEVKMAYRKLVRRHHPDRNPGDDAEIKAINEAYEILMKFCKNYNYSFLEEDVRRQLLPDHMEMFSGRSK